MERVTIVKEGRAGQVAATYAGEVVRREDGLLVVRCPWTLPRVDVGLLAFEPGDVLDEHYYATEWFNIFQVHSAAGALKGWYCNVTYPARLDGAAGEIRWRDLALDLVVLPDGRSAVLDEDEFAALDLTPQERRRAREALARLQAWAREGRPPFRAAP